MRERPASPCTGDNGVEWPIQRLKTLSTTPIVNGVGAPGEFDNLTWPRYVRITDIADRKSLKSDTFKSQPPEVACQAEVRRGDLLLAAVGATYGISVLYESDSAACFAGYLVRVRPQTAIDGRFLSYWTETVDYWDQLRSEVVQATIQNFSAAKYRRLGVPWPDEGVRSCVVDYLDSETARIDALIDRKQRFTDLLIEKRTALITHAVTKGLDPDAEMKDSGAPWFGPIPATWPVVRLGYFARVRNGSTPSRNDPSYWTDGSVPWLSSGKVNEDRIFEASEFVTETALRECSIEVIPAGSVVIGLIGQGRTRGTASLLGIDATINQNMAAIVSHGMVHGRYLQYQLANMYGAIREYGRGGNQAALNCELVADLRIPLPGFGEQEEIAQFLDTETVKIDELAGKTRRSIDLLREYRTALISAAVTGQIDIPGTETSEDVA